MLIYSVPHIFFDPCFGDSALKIRSHITNSHWINKSLWWFLIG